jgi:hypothetical protein
VRGVCEGPLCAKASARIPTEGDASASYGLYHLGVQVYEIDFHLPMMSTAATSPQAAVRKVRCYNRAATEVERARTEQESNGARNGKNCLDKLDFRQGSTYPESFDLTNKEGGAGSNPASPTCKLCRNSGICGPLEALLAR